MNLKEFVKNVIIDLDSAVSEANENTKRKFSFREVSGQKTSLGFDIAVTVEKSDEKNNKGGIKVLEFFQAGLESSEKQINSSVSRINFNLDISTMTNEEIENQNNFLKNNKPIYR